MKRFEINGNVYEPAEMDLNAFADFDEMGITMDKLMGFSAIRAYFALCSGLTKDGAGAELEQHVLNGGKLDEINEAYGNALAESDFFRKITEIPTESDPEDETEAVEEEEQKVVEMPKTKSRSTKKKATEV